MELLLQILFGLAAAILVGISLQPYGKIKFH